MKELVQNAISERLKGFRDYKSLLSQYKTELDTNKGYNGRQLLEMFQNCEDEGAKKVKINFDTENCLLEISNDGKRAFSLDGYDSLLYPGLSSKVSSGYIGNKGLGFRSIVNWAKEINIISNGFIVKFKEEYKKDTLLNILGFTEGDLDIIRKKRNLKSTVYPIPLLNCAKVKDLDFEHTFTTTVSIKYDKNFEEDIRKQLEDISPMTLLFLKNIEEVEVVGNVINSNINVKRKDDTYGQEVKYLDNIYYVISDEGEIDQELIDNNDSVDAKKYSVKIAFSKDLTLKDNVLYNYFKTQIPFELPFVAHASLELDQNRNHSTESPVNPFVLEKLFELHLKLVEILKQRNVKSWLPYLAIDNDTFNVYKPYSDLIDEHWGDFKVFPAISGYYYNRDDINTLGNDIAYFIDENYLGAELKSHVIFCDIEISALKYVGRNSNHKLAIENLASQLDYAKRAQLIKLVLNSYPKESFDILIDDKGDLISSDKYVYTDKTSGNDDIRVPSYSDICFIHPLLYRELVRELELKGESQNVSRLLKDKLEHISDVHSFEPQVVLRKIIGETNEVLQKSDVDIKTVIREFYSVLLHNYNIRGEVPRLDYNSKIPCLNRKREIVDVRKLVMSNEFSIGKISEKIFEKSLYDAGDIIAPVSEFGLIDGDSCETFFEWLGLQKFFIIDEIEENLYPAYREYINGIHDVNISSYKLYNLRSFDDLVKKFTINQIILWLSIDDKVKSIFGDFTRKSSGHEQLIYSYRGLRHIYSFSNLIFFIIERAFNISCYLITSKREEWFNPFKIDYEYLKAKNQSLTKVEVDRILRFFGAKDDFNKLNIDYLRDKTQELAVRGNPRGAQLFYKNLVGHYRFNKQKINDVDLFANEGGELVVKPANEVYYSDRILLPEKLTQKFPVFHYPSRSGGMAAIEAFGLNDLNDLDLDIHDFQINMNILEDFDKLLKEVKPFILAFRMDGISKEDVKRSQVVKLNGLKINCCNHIKCSINDNLFLIERFNYVYNNGEYYILIPEDLTINDLKCSKEFISSLSDIYLKLFDTSDEKKTFENIIRQSKEDNIFDVNNDLADGVLEEALTLLGEISMRLSIWKGIFKVKEIDTPNDINDRNLEDFIYLAFPILKDQELFNDLDIKKALTKIREIFLILEVDLEIFNSYTDLNISFDHLFQEELEDYYNLKKKTLRNQLWHSISKKNSKQQKEFLDKLLKIESLLNGVRLDKNLSNYNFDEIIYRELNKVFPEILFHLNSNSFEDYDLIQIQNDKQFSHDDLQLLKKKPSLESLKYFAGNLDHLTYELDQLKKDLIVKEEKDEKNEFVLNDFKVPIKVMGFDVELTAENKLGSYSNEPWLGGVASGLSNSGKKKLGNDVENLVFNYLKNLDYCSEVDHVSKTHEGLHYDIRYINTIDKVTKYVECKYYNGTSFYLSGEEKRFADNHLDQYELWLVDNDLKIYVIKDLRVLGELQAVNYRVNLILKEHDLKI